MTHTRLLSLPFVKYWHQSDDVQGIGWMVVSCFWFAVLATLVRFLSAEMHAFTMVFFRSVVALSLMLPWVLKYGKNAIHTKRFPLHVSRSITGVLGMLLFFSGLAVIPMTQAIALSFTVPLFTTLAAIVFLNEKVGWHRWAAMAVGFAGALVILHPSSKKFEAASLLVVAATCMWALSNISIKKMVATENPRTMLFYMTFLAVPLSLPFALMHWHMPTGKEWLFLIALGAVSNISQLCLFRAYSKAEVSVILPVDFSRLIFVTILGTIFFNETVDWYTGLGALIILASTVYIVRREA